MISTMRLIIDLFSIPLVSQTFPILDITIIQILKQISSYTDRNVA